MTDSLYNKRMIQIHTSKALAADLKTHLTEAPAGALCNGMHTVFMFCAASV